MTKRTLKLLVGDNPFHGISHLSQARARTREQAGDSSGWAAGLVGLSLDNGADGFMFSVDELTLSIIEQLSKRRLSGEAGLYAIAPYTYEFVRKSTSGGVSGLVAGVGKEMVFSSNAKVLLSNAGGLLRLRLPAVLKTYVAYELSRIKRVSKANGSLRLKGFMLQETVTDMALALNMKQLFTAYIKFVENYRIKAGFETRNFPYLVNKFSEWGIDASKLVITASFNSVGFQMCPTQDECEEALERITGAEVIAMSILAAGYLKPQEAISYVESLGGISGVVVGVSKEHHATETFRVLRQGN